MSKCAINVIYRFEPINLNDEKDYLELKPFENTESNGAQSFT